LFLTERIICFRRTVLSDCSMCHCSCFHAQLVG